MRKAWSLLSDGARPPAVSEPACRRPASRFEHASRPVASRLAPTGQVGFSRFPQRGGANKKPPQPWGCGGLLLNPGGDLLSHGLVPHYHRRNCVSLPSSEWNRVGPQRYGRQKKVRIAQSARFRHGAKPLLEVRPWTAACSVRGTSL